MFSGKMHGRVADALNRQPIFKNAAGGVAYQSSDAQKLRRFLLLGTESSTMYASASDISDSALVFLRQFITSDPMTVLSVIGEMADRLPHKREALWAMAMVSGTKFVPVDSLKSFNDLKIEAYGYVDIGVGNHQAVMTQLYSVLGRLVGTFGDLLEFLLYKRIANGKRLVVSSGLKNFVSGFFNSMGVDDIHYQLNKYGNKAVRINGNEYAINVADVLNLTHYKHPLEPQRLVLSYWYNYYSVGKDSESTQRALDLLATRTETQRIFESTATLRLVNQFVNTIDTQEGYEYVAPMLLNGIEQYGWTWEVIAPNYLVPEKSAWARQIWSALIGNDQSQFKMPMNAMLRMISRLESYGYLGDNDDSQGLTNQIVQALNNRDRIVKSRINPFRPFVTWGYYRKTTGAGTLLLKSLEQAITAAYRNVKPHNKKVLYAIDGSGSMNCDQVTGTGMDASQVAIALAAIFKGVESNLAANYAVVFDGRVRKVIEPTLADIDMDMPGGETNCASPIQWAEANHKGIGAFDAFVIITDSQSWYGNSYNVQDALDHYREKYNPNAKLVVLQLTGDNGGLFRQDCSYCLELVGFDASAIDVINTFIALD